MGVDYDSVSGIGVEFTYEMTELCIRMGIFTDKEWSDDWYACMDKIGITWSEGGDASYGGDRRLYFKLYPCKTLGEALTIADGFCKKLFDIGIVIKKEELQIISDIHTY